jgi:hypothetical protein
MKELAPVENTGADRDGGRNMFPSITHTASAAIALLLGAMPGAAFLQEAHSQAPKQKPLVIAAQGDFYVGGQIVFSPATSSSGEGDPNPGHVVVDQVYVQYQVPEKGKYRLPLILAHGSWHTGKTYGSTPDGREGGAPTSFGEVSQPTSSTM